MQVEGGERVYAIADEDLERENEEKTSSVHFLRFELAAAGASVAPRRRLTIGIDHPNYDVRAEIGAATRDALAGDLA